MSAGQYQDAESQWVSKRLRYYDPTVEIYGEQDVLGLEARLAAAQG